MFGKSRGRWLATAMLAALLVPLLPLFAAGAQKGSNASSGPALYAKYCANCHGGMEKSLLANRSSSRIRSAIAQLPAMSGLKGLAETEIEAIVAALADSSAK